MPMYRFRVAPKGGDVRPPEYDKVTEAFEARKHVSDEVWIELADGQRFGSVLRP